MKAMVGTALVVVSLVSPLSADLTKTASRKAAPNFTLQGSHGAPIRLSALKGKVVLLDFWATWCAPCKLEIPWFMEFQELYAEKGLTAVGVAMDDEGWEKVKPYLNEHPINYPIVIGGADMAKRYKVTTLPVTLLIDRNGKIAATHIGLVEKASFEKDLRTLLQERH
jgi:cytochrome c biogenesis protein CcmG/thiol:disulfide interchange protein DsbE